MEKWVANTTFMTSYKPHGNCGNYMYFATYRQLCSLQVLLLLLLTRCARKWSVVGQICLADRVDATQLRRRNASDWVEDSAVRQTARQLPRYEIC
jgi:hypothetical protein